jgi:hypothetical protein
MIEGVFEGIIASAIFAAGMYVFSESILPEIRGRLQRLPKLNRTLWNRIYVDGRQHARSMLTIKQSGNRIDATIERSNGATQRIFKYRGRLLGHQIVLQWEDVDSPEVVVGAMVLHLSQDLTKLSGQTVYFSQEKGKVVSAECIYVRVHGEVI